MHYALCTCTCTCTFKFAVQLPASSVYWSWEWRYHVIQAGDKLVDGEREQWASGAQYIKVRGGTSLDVRFKVWGVFREVTVRPVVLAF